MESCLLKLIRVWHLLLVIIVLPWSMQCCDSVGRSGLVFEKKVQLFERVCFQSQHPFCFLDVYDITNSCEKEIREKYLAAVMKF